MYYSGFNLQMLLLKYCWTSTLHKQLLQMYNIYVLVRNYEKNAYTFLKSSTYSQKEREESILIIHLKISTVPTKIKRELFILSSTLPMV